MMGGLALRPAPALAQRPATWEVKYQNGIAAVVNDKIITKDQVQKEMAPLVPRIRDDVQSRDGTEQDFDDQITKVAHEILHNMVDNILIIQAFKDKGYAIPDSYLSQRYDETITTQFGGDREKFLDYLKENNLTERAYRQQISDDVMIGYMKSQLRSTPTVISPGRVVKFYDEHKQQYYQDAAVELRQITLKPYADETTDLLLQQARAIVQQARAPNANFADLARKDSQDEYQGNGGDMGWIEKGKFVPEIETLIFALKPGDVSDPITSGGNVYIFQCEDKRDAGIQPLDKVHVQIEYALLTDDTRQAEEKWLEKLRKNAYVKYNM
jgi:peptidyl-prolyl cis-trans isomerase SurA